MNKEIIKIIIKVLIYALSLIASYLGGRCTAATGGTIWFHRNRYAESF